MNLESLDVFKSHLEDTTHSFNDRTKYLIQKSGQQAVNFRDRIYLASVLLDTLPQEDESNNERLVRLIQKKMKEWEEFAGTT